MFPSVYWAKVVPEKARFIIRPFASQSSLEWKAFSQNHWHLTPALSSSYGALPNIIQIVSLPDYAQWIENVNKALEAIDNKKIEKVVLARRITFTFEKPLHPSRLHSFLLLGKIAADANTTFFTTTPETLYRRENRHISCDALAGTRPLSRAKELQESAKDLHEFRLVQNFLVEQLKPFCTHPPTTQPISLRYTSTTAHLYAPVEGILRAGVTDEELIEALHPTPAVAGHPREAALAFIASLEPFVRGLYAAPLGWVSETHAEMMVGIRSCLIEGNHLHLYVGAGIVAGSDPHAEWEETELKWLHWKNILDEASI